MAGEIKDSQNQSLIALVHVPGDAALFRQMAHLLITESLLLPPTWNEQGYLILSWKVA